MDILSEVHDLCKNPMALLNEYKNSAVKVVGYTCSYIPEELIISTGLQPYRISNIGASMSALVPSFVCPFASTVLENTLRFESFLSGLVIAHTCDSMWRMYDILKKKIDIPLFLLRVPHNTDNKLSLDFFRLELIRFKKFLEENFEARITDDALLSAIELCNETRDLLRGMYMLNVDGKYKVSAFDRFHLVLASMWVPKREYNARIRRLEFHSEAYGNVRLHVSGTTIYDLNLIQTIEESGSFIASDDLCTSSRYFWSNVEKLEDPISALSKRYLQKTPCPSHGPLRQRLEYISSMIEEFNVQGVITLANRFCDPILYDSVHIGKMLEERGISSMVIDYENSAQEIGRIKTRVEAFIESLGG